MNSHRRLAVWSHAGELIDVSYELTRALPADERYVATPQLRRAAWSVQNNIAEGHARFGRKERRRFLRIAIGSLAEVDSMVCKLHELYDLDIEIVSAVESLRRRINAGLFRMMKRHQC
jgi:four helix bundle protein